MAIAEREPEAAVLAGSPPDRPPDAPAMTFRRWLAAMLGALPFLVLATLAIRFAELRTGRYMSAGVPPLMAVMSLLLLLGWRSLAARLPGAWSRLAPDRGQLLLMFSMLCLGILMTGQYTVRALLPHLVTLQYWQSHGNSALARWTPYLPSWYAPTDPEAIARFWEGSRGAGVPWQLWAGPLLRWGLFFAAFYAAGVSLVAMIRRQWVEHERLSFPLLYLPLSLTAGEEGAVFGGKPLFRHPLLWLGCGIAAVFNGFNIGHALNPAIPASGFSYSFRGLFPDAPWTPLNSLMLFYMPEAIGFGYFVPLEVSFSAWFFYVAEKLFAVGGVAAGYEAPGFPYIQDQCAGAYLGVCGLLLYGARRHLAGVLGRGFGWTGGPRTPEEREERTALYVFLGATAFLAVWALAAGFSLVIAAPFFGILLCFILVYARIRAETGVPFEVVYPYGLAKELLVNLLTPRGILDAGGPRTWVTFSSFAWLSRHHSIMSSAAYSLDGMKLAEEARVPRRWLYAALGVGVACGLALGFWAHLSAYYDHGANLAGGGKIEYRASVAVQEYGRMATSAATATPRDNGRLTAQAAGGLFAVGLGLLRTVWVGSPFHPLGFILATSYGDHTTIFFPMLAAWLLKALILHLGGLPLYRRLIPLFCGLIVGHCLIGGIFWPLFSLLLAPEASQSYHLMFGG